MKPYLITFGVISIIGLSIQCSKKNVDTTPLEEPLPKNPVVSVPVLEEPQKVETSPPVSLEADPLQFAFNSYHLNEESLDKLFVVGNYLRNNPEKAVTITGFTCPIGSEEYNLALGWNRAYAAQKWLVDFGIEPSRIVCNSYGEEPKWLKTEERELYELNRRDEFEIASNQIGADYN